MRWTDEELCELITLWPTHSAKEIAVKMGRPRSAITNKVKQLRANSRLPHGVHGHFEARTIMPRPRPRRGQSRTAGSDEDGGEQHR